MITSDGKRRRVVVTGLGAVSPLGADVEVMWQRLIAGRSGVRRLPDDMVPDIAAKVAGIVPTIEEDAFGFDPDRAVGSKDRKKMDRFIRFAMDAAQQAATQAGIVALGGIERSRSATIIASGIGGLDTILDAKLTIDGRGSGRLSPFTVPSFLINLAAGQVSIRYGLSGPIGAPATACAASNQAIGDAMRLIVHGEADLAICGGAEACINRVSLGGFNAARALSTSFNDTPERASRPFDMARDGFVMGEGAGILVIEALEHALKRGAAPLAELVGYGTTADAYHMTGAPPDGDGARRAMQQALAMAELEPATIGYVNAHATSTPVGDAGELAAMKGLFGTRNGPAVSSTKAATGHLLGAAGGLEAIISIMALRDGRLPPNLNLERPDPAADGVDLIGRESLTRPIDYALSNGFGFGGVNACVIFRRWNDDDAARGRSA